MVCSASFQHISMIKVGGPDQFSLPIANRFCDMLRYLFPFPCLFLAGSQEISLKTVNNLKPNDKWSSQAVHQPKPALLQEHLHGFSDTATEQHSHF